MKKLKVIAVIIVLIVVLGAGVFFAVVPGMVEKSMNKVVEHSTYDISQAARDKHARLIIMDWHSDSLLWNRDLMKRSNYGHMDVPRLVEGNVATERSKLRIQHGRFR
jgi:hypothetical protein